MRADVRRWSGWVRGFLGCCAVMASTLWAQSGTVLPAPAAAPAAASAPVPAGGGVGDAAFERRVMRLADLLRCLVCQNQTIADSNAELANDLKNQIREQLRQGRTEEQIVQFMVERYGDFVLYKPPLKTTTALLWFGPVLLILGATVVVVLMVRRRPVAAAPALDEQQNQAVDRLLSDPPKEGA